jgi:hypothetical protein
MRMNGPEETLYTDLFHSGRMSAVPWTALQLNEKRTKYCKDNALNVDATGPSRRHLEYAG